MSSFRMQNFVTSRAAIFAEKVFELDRLELIFMTGSHIVNVMEFIFATDRFQRLQM